MSFNVMPARCYRLVWLLALCGMLLMAAACTPVEKRIDRVAGGPNAPADTAVLMQQEQGKQPEPAVANHLKALINLYRQDGSLLDRRRISAPGHESVQVPKG